MYNQVSFLDTTRIFRIFGHWATEPYDQLGLDVMNGITLTYVQYMRAHTRTDTCTCTTLSECDEIHLILSNARKITYVQ